MALIPDGYTHGIEWLKYLYHRLNKYTLVGGFLGPNQIPIESRDFLVDLWVILLTLW